MTGIDQSLGARLHAAQPTERFGLHTAGGDRHEFGDYDRVLAGLFDRVIRGNTIIHLELAESRTENDVVVLDLDDRDSDVIARVLAPEAQQARGGWYMPNGDKALLGIVEFAHWAAAEPRFSISAAEVQRAGIALETPDAIAIWAALEPVMELLYLPLKLRSGYWIGNRRPDQMAKDWAAVDAAYHTLAIDTDPLGVFKDGRQWARLSIEEVIAARQTLLDAWHSAPIDVGDRAIVLLISGLIERYYQKAKDGKAQRTKVMNKSLERALSGAFGGDWLAFVRYLGEEVHPAEQIATAVEPTSLIVSGHDRAAQAATATGVPVEEIERVLAAYWGGQGDSPIDQRARVMCDWWDAFDALHARQVAGMPSLWGLLGDRFEDITDNANDGRYTRRGYLMLPHELNTQIEQLWGTAVLSRWPQSLVSEPYPQASFAETLGVGIAFWHDVALTCWFVCEGPYSRTDIAGMSQYYDQQLKTLNGLGCPIDSGLFVALSAAETRLSDRPSSGNDTWEHHMAGGLTFSITARMGQSKKDGFEHLRDVVTKYRRAWAERYLDRYLQSGWERDIRTVGDRYHRHVADKGKPPTLKQFAKMAEHPVNHWFGGNLSQLSNVLRLPAPDTQKRRKLMPADRGAFVASVSRLLEIPQRPLTWAHDERDKSRADMAQRALEVVQIWEATGEKPQPKQTSWAHYRLEAAFGPDTEAGWDIYIAAIEKSLSDSANVEIPLAGSHPGGSVVDLDETSGAPANPSSGTP